MIRDFKVSALGMGMDHLRVVVQISVGTRFFVPRNVQTRFEARSSFYSVVTDGSSSECKAVGQ
jgi:hypothetical protein